MMLRRPGEVLHRQTRVGLRIDGRDEARRISEALVAADANLHIANPARIPQVTDPSDAVSV